MNVHAFASYDDILLASLEVEVAFGVELADVAGVKPALLVEHRLQLLSLPIAGGYIGAAHQDFAARVKLHLAAFEHLADRAAAGAEGMVQRNQRGRLGGTVGLNQKEAEATPECCRLRVERRATGDEGPELPAEAVMNAPETPPAPREVLVFGL